MSTMQLGDIQYIVYHPEEDKFVRLIVETYLDPHPIAVVLYDELKHMEGYSLDWLTKLISYDLVNIDYERIDMEFLSKCVLLPTKYSVDIDYSAAFKWSEEAKCGNG